MPNHSTEQIREFASYLENQIGWDDFQTVRTQAIDEGCNPTGFKGLLEPLQGGMAALEALVSEAIGVAGSRAGKTAAGLQASAQRYDETEQDHVDRLTDVHGKLGEVR